jgi:short-subunit dehydrogenase
VLVARREDELQRLAAELGGDAEIELCDVADRVAVAATTARILERHEAVDLLVNSAGILVRGSFVDAPLDEIERALVVNYLGCVWVTRGLLDGLREAARANGRSHIATIASTAGVIVFTPGAPYSASKFAQVAFSRSLRASLRGTGVEVHTIMPGFVTTPGFPHPKIFATPLGRPFVIGPERVARKVLSAVERGKAELIVPWFPYGIGAMAQAVLPRTTARVLKQFDYPDSA